MSDHPIEGMMNITMEKIKQMVDVNTIIGDAITTPDGSVIIPVSKVTYGFAAGGSDFPTKKPESKDLFGGGSGAGITISPVAFISISNGDVKLLQIQSYNTPADRVVGMVPDAVEKIVSMFKKIGSNKADEKHEPQSTEVDATVDVDVKVDASKGQ